MHDDYSIREKRTNERLRFLEDYVRELSHLIHNLQHNIYQNEVHHMANYQESISTVAPGNPNNPNNPNKPYNPGNPNNPSNPSRPRNPTSN